MLNIFEKKNNTVAFFAVLIAAISWGSFSAMVSYIQIKFLSPLVFTLISVFFAAFITFSIILTFKIKFKDVIRKLLSKKAKTARHYLLMRGIFFYNLIFLIIGFYLLENKIIGIIIYELYPIMTVFLSYRYYKDYEQKNIWYVLTIIGIAASALILFLLTSENTATIDLLNFIKEESIWGLIFVFMGAIFNAFYVIYGKLLTEEGNKIFGKIPTVRHVFVTQGLVYLFATSGLLLISIIYYSVFASEGELKEIWQIDFYILFIILLFAFFTNILVSNLARLGHSTSNSHYIYLLWMISPIIGILSLWVLNFGEINIVIILSFILILVPNILLNLDIEESFSFKAIFIWILLSAIFLFYHQGKAIDSETYFNSANALLVFFALMVGYLINKLNERSNFREQLFMRFLHKARANGTDEKAIESISVKFQQSNNRLTDKVKNIINYPSQKYEQLNQSNS